MTTKPKPTLLKLRANFYNYNDDNTNLQSYFRMTLKNPVFPRFRNLFHDIREELHSKNQLGALSTKSVMIKTSRR